MSISCIIVEDLIVAADYLRKCCEKSGEIEVKAHFTNVKEAVSFLNENTVDLIFLDVEMPGDDGFVLLDQLVYSPKVILTTSKTEYAYNAFEYHVTDFLKKPYTYQRFQEAINKISLTATDDSKRKENDDDHIYIKTDGKLVRLNNADILYIESMGDYVKFVLVDKKYVTHNTIKNLEEKVNPGTFMKIHRSYIVNIRKVDNIRDNSIFINGIELPISKANKADVLKRLNVI
jgi:DNA-binding LytR/AlgR family response regulator